METMASHRAYKLAGAIENMADRYARAERKSAYAFGLYLSANTSGNTARADVHRAESDRWDRASARRRRALTRLIDALRDVDCR